MFRRGFLCILRCFSTGHKRVLKLQCGKDKAVTLAFGRGFLRLLVFCISAVCGSFCARLLRQHHLEFYSSVRRLLTAACSSFSGMCRCVRKVASGAFAGCECEGRRKAFEREIFCGIVSGYVNEGEGGSYIHTQIH